MEPTMRRHACIVAVLAITTFAAAASAQSAESSADPDRSARGGGVLPAGWRHRFDRANARAAELKVVRVPNGLHITTGPATILWRPANTARGAYEVRASFTQLKAAAHPEAYGLFLGGRALTGEKQEYLYFVVRQDGRYLVKHRVGTEVHTVVDWTADAAIRGSDAAGRSTNALAVRVSADSLRFMVNGTRVASLPRPAAMGETGTYGVRINHNLDVRVTGLTATPTARARRGAQARGAVPAAKGT